jgi:hypothetical protein
MEPVEKATIKEFAAQISGISPNMRKIQIEVLVERLLEEHGIEVDADTLLKMAR